MKSIILMVAFTLGLSAISLEGYTQQKPLSAYSTEALDAINATPEQRKATEQMLDRFKPRINELRAQQSNMPAYEYKAKWGRLMGERADEFAKILTPEQKKQVDELVAASKKTTTKKATAKSAAKTAKFSPYSEETINALGLTTEQRKATEQMLDRFKPRINELRAQQSSMPANEYKARWGRLMGERADAYAEIIGPEKKKELDELTAEARKNR